METASAELAVQYRGYAAQRVILAHRQSGAADKLALINIA